MRRLVLGVLRIVDLVSVPITALAALWLGFIRRAGIHRMVGARWVFRQVGVFPIRDHYYDPIFHTGKLARPLSDVRALPGIDFNIEEQHALLDQFHYNDELTGFSLEAPAERGFYYSNTYFESGDAEFLYNMIRHYRPQRMIEIGSGYSTMLAAAALRRNRQDDPAHACDHVCVEPYEAPWLESLGVRVVREPVERLGVDYFRALDRNDILFIDSSHIIRPQGDVLFEYLELLPQLRSGVLVHVHDIFTPRDLPREWIDDYGRLWNEQYLLEAFLSCSGDFRVIGALNMLTHDHFDRLSAKCPILAQQPGREPGSFWMVRN